MGVMNLLSRKTRKIHPFPQPQRTHFLQHHLDAYGSLQCKIEYALTHPYSHWPLYPHSYPHSHPHSLFHPTTCPRCKRVFRKSSMCADGCMHMGTSTSSVTDLLSAASGMRRCPVSPGPTLRTKSRRVLLEALGRRRATCGAGFVCFPLMINT